MKQKHFFGRQKKQRVDLLMQKCWIKFYAGYVTSFLFLVGMGVALWQKVYSGVLPWEVDTHFEFYLNSCLECWSVIVFCSHMNLLKLMNQKNLFSRWKRPPSSSPCGWGLRTGEKYKMVSFRRKLSLRSWHRLSFISVAALSTGKLPKATHTFDPSWCCEID